MPLLLFLAAALVAAGQSPATVNVFFDGNYANRPANTFSLNQTGLVLERPTDPAAGRRWGLRLDLMAGQATEYLQGSPLNEPRPHVYRHLFQAYASYVLPVRRGLTLDFGKIASALGPEGNYAKDQVNYTRGYFFHLLPYYHMGLRASYPVNGKLTAAWWFVNGANQTEDFNRFKSHLTQAIVKPRSNLSWTLNYFNGREQPTVNGYTPRGRLHILDTYASWTPAPRLTLTGHMTYLVNRVEPTGPPQRVNGGAAYARFQLSPRLWLGQRYVHLNDPAGLFSGRSRNLNDSTSTFAFRPAEGFETRLEYRRDTLLRDTVTVALLAWFGGKTGGW